jgi:hypothetical protein
MGEWEKQKQQLTGVLAFLPIHLLTCGFLVFSYSPTHLLTHYLVFAFTGIRTIADVASPCLSRQMLKP